jgi:hypothetical protein
MGADVKQRNAAFAPVAVVGVSIQGPLRSGEAWIGEIQGHADKFVFVPASG